MGSSIPDSLLKSAAFKLFLEEIAKHMANASTRIGQGTALSADECRSLGAAFHTIRGSAGFFNLQEISSISKQLEEQLLAENIALPLDVSTIKLSVAKLQKLTDELCKGSQV